jgi:hypothetical protein
MRGLIPIIRMAIFAVILAAIAVVAFSCKSDNDRERTSRIFTEPSPIRLTEQFTVQSGLATRSGWPTI